MKRNRGRPKKQVQVEEAEDVEDEEYDDDESSEIVEAETATRRSARQQQRKSTGVSNKRNDDFQYSFPRPSVSAQNQRKRRFLTDHVPGKGSSKQESTASVISRLVSKKATSPRNILMTSASAGLKGKKEILGKQSRPTPTPGPSTSMGSRVSMQSSPGGASGKIRNSIGRSKKTVDPDWVPGGEVEENNEEEETFNSGPEFSEPKKRGRKRKEEETGLISIKTEGLFENENRKQPQKRGRKSFATHGHPASRFPFCSVCLSKAPPTDYIANHVVHENERQRLRSMFQYIYKDLKLPLVPFDFEKEIVFDYCDLPLCDSCLSLYQEMYNAYSAIEDAQAQLKSKMEFMINNMQYNEKNPVVTQQIVQIKSSNDPIMHKYSNFRKRFLSYNPVELRGSCEGQLLPATLARVRIISQVPKTTTSTQTVLTTEHFPVPPPSRSQNVKNTDDTITNQSTSDTSKTTNLPSAAAATVAPKLPAKTENDKLSPKVNGSKEKNEGAPIAIARKQPSSTPSISSGKVANTPINTNNMANKADQVPEKVPTTTSLSTESAKPQRSFPAAAVLTIVKTPGGKGPAIIRTIPGSGSALLNYGVPKPADKLQPISISVKDEPEDEIPEIPEDGSDDPFLSATTGRLVKPGTSRPNKNESESAQSCSAKDSVEDDTNVFRKHKKLTVPSTVESPSESATPPESGVEKE